MPATARADAPGVASGAGILGLLEPIYAVAARLRGALYDRGWIAAHRLGVPVISVGNLSAGGSGKSPMVALVAGHLARAGFRPAVISRGYGGRHAGRATVVSSGSGPLVGADVAGDEPVMLARMLPELPIVVAHRRREGGALAIARLGARCLVLDDGFQHRSLARDLDLVLLDARQGFGNGRLLPAGPLREPPSALSRAGALILTRCDRAVPAAVEALAAAAVRHSPGSELFHARSKPVGLMDAASGVATGLDRLAGARAVCFAGIAHPSTFFEDVAAAGAHVVASIGFQDHHRFCREDLARVDRAAREGRADLILTTEKDLARIGRADPAPASAPLLALRQEMRVDEQERFHALLERTVS